MPFAGSKPTDFTLDRRGDLVDLYVRQGGVTITTITMEAATAFRVGTRLADMGLRAMNNVEEPEVEDAWAL